MILEAIVEIPKGSKYKYEIDKEHGNLILDRPLNQPVPFNYGFVPDTLCEDGDQLDIFIVSAEPIPPLTRVKVNVFAVLRCQDGGAQDDKLVGHIVGESQVMLAQTYGPTRGLWYLERYLSTYKEGFVVESASSDMEEVKAVYEQSVSMYKANIWDGT